MIGHIQKVFQNGWQEFNKHTEQLQIRQTATKIYTVSKIIFETCVMAFLFYLNPYVFPLALVVGMAQIPHVQTAIEKIVAIWERYWPLICLIVIPAIYWSCTAITDRSIGALLTCAAALCALHWGGRIAHWIQSQSLSSPSYTPCFYPVL